MINIEKIKAVLNRVLNFELEKEIEETMWGHDKIIYVGDNEQLESVKEDVLKVLIELEENKYV